jgi:hypothetical protein
VVGPARRATRRHGASAHGLLCDFRWSGRPARRCRHDDDPQRRRRPVPAVDGADPPTTPSARRARPGRCAPCVLGRFDTRLPRGLAREVVEEFDALVGLLERRNRDLLRIGRVVGREGRMLERLNEEAYDGAWAEGVHAVNALIDDLGQSAAETAG